MGRPYDERGLSRILDRRWLLSSPQVKIHEVLLSNAKEAGGTCANLFSFSSNLHPALGEKLKESRQRRNSFYVIRDDLLHPLISGNKTRKLDALLPLIEAHSVTDVVTCGGCQSAHAAALAVACAERGIQAHLLLRGEQPEIPTGYNLISEMYGHVIYVPRSVYANREALLARHASLIAGDDGSIMWLHDEVKMSPMPVENYASHQHGSKVHMSCIATCTSTRKVAVVKEGGGDAVALLGLIRLVDYLSQPSLFGRDQTVQIVVDSGTGTTAVGLALGALLLGLPWKVTGIMLADTAEGYEKHKVRLLTEFKKLIMGDCIFTFDEKSVDLVHWIERQMPRKFGRVFKGELELCREIAQRTGILLDPVYTLSSWEHASLTCQKCINSNDIVVMLHTGGTLGLFGLAQRYKSFFPLSQENIAKPALCV
ncbi:D-cysteine desulfhydrase 2, mitochondrial isoform X2 [Cryptomeria japonica]|nr:D-cysteine desulfhydrase 2, mitochondrial isoform X2 [Cryptomeria japonica]